jgi:2-methylcitrate dehydratase PrpD
MRPGERHKAAPQPPPEITGTTAALAKFLAELKLESTPPGIIAETKNLLLDCLACIIAGARSAIGPLVISQMAFFGSGTEASVAGLPSGVSLMGAAYGNGRLGNCLDFDETYPGGAVGGSHFGVAAVSAALALCEQRGLGGKELLLATLAGYELGGRVADVGSQLVFEDGRLRGMPPVWGLALPFVYAAAGAAGKVLGSGPREFFESFGLAGADTPAPVGPMWSAMMTLPNTKYCDSGWCTLAGLFAALSAGAGSTGPNPIFEGDRSVFHMIGINKIDPDGLVGELGSRWALENITYKPWPTCRWHHQALTALLRLRDREELEPGEIEAVMIETNTGLLSPRFRNPEPPNLIARQFSFPHAVAMLLSRVPSGHAWLSDEQSADPGIVALRRKVTVEEHPRASECARYFVRDQVRQMPSGVSVYARGTIFREESDFALGDPWHPATRWSYRDVSEKFRTVSGLPQALAESVIAAVAELEALPDLRPISSALRCVQPPTA